MTCIRSAFAVSAALRLAMRSLRSRRSCLRLNHAGAGRDDSGADLKLLRDLSGSDGLGSVTHDLGWRRSRGPCGRQYAGKIVETALRKKSFATRSLWDLCRRCPSFSKDRRRLMPFPGMRLRDRSAKGDLACRNPYAWHRYEESRRVPRQRHHYARRGC